MFKELKPRNFLDWLGIHDELKLEVLLIDVLVAFKLSYRQITEIHKKLCGTDGNGGGLLEAEETVYGSSRVLGLEFFLKFNSETWIASEKAAGREHCILQMLDRRAKQMHYAKTVISHTIYEVLLCFCFISIKGLGGGRREGSVCHSFVFAFRATLGQSGCIVLTLTAIKPAKQKTSSWPILSRFSSQN